MTVLHIRSTSGFYGAERVISTLLPRLHALGANQVLVALHCPLVSTGSLLNPLREAGVPVHSLLTEKKFDLRVIREIIAICKNSAVVAIHTHDYKSALYGKVVAAVLGLPLIATVHGWTAATTRLRIYESLERWLYRSYAAVITVSQTQSETLRRSGCLPNRLHSVPNGVEPRGAENLPVRPAPSQARPFTWITVSRLSPEKGIDDLLSAFGSLDPALGQRLIILGEGPEGQRLRAMSVTQGVDERVSWRGHVADVAEQFRNADAYVCSSHTEGTPMSVLEAMAAGLPVVATAVGSLPAMLAGGAGLLTPARDPMALAASMRQLSAEIGLCYEMGRRAACMIVENYSIEMQARRYMDIYREVLHGS